MADHIHRPALGNLEETGRLAIGLGVYVQWIENRGPALRWKLLRNFAKALQIFHLAASQERAKVSPPLRPSGGTNTHEPPARFQDFQTSLPGIAATILSDRLKLMEEHGLVTRSFYSDHPPRAEYVLTDKGQELGGVVGALAAWGSRYVHPHTRLVHTDCAHPVQVGYYCPHCNTRVEGPAVSLQSP